jgi:fucose permease
MYPILMNHCARILPRWILAAAVGVVASTGQTGSAILPFLTGVIASRAGIVALQPL